MAKVPDTGLPAVPPRGTAAPDLLSIVGGNLKRLRTRNGYSLERLAKSSGVSRAMLGQIESGKSAPTINILWKIASALSVPFATLTAVDTSGGTQVLRQDDAKILTSNDGKFTSRALFPFDAERRVEFYELRIAPRHTENAPAHAGSTRENILVIRGAVEITIGKEAPVALGEGDAIVFAADVPHRYRNLAATETVMALVMTYVETIG